MAQSQNEKSYLVLDQYRESSEYNDFIGKYYHFPSKHLSLLSQPNIEFVYYEPKKNGEGVYHGFGKIVDAPFKDKREDGFYFVEISNYKPFSKPVPFEDADGPRETAPFYNPQNAVRRTTKEILEGICLDGGIVLYFKADSHLLRVLGEELIATEKVGILELVKNSYDAHATYCKVRIENVPGLEVLSENQQQYPSLKGPVIVVEDDGDGMDRNAIENGWLRPAATTKTTIKEKLRKEKEEAIRTGKIGVYEGLIKKLKKEHGNRLPLGEKGVGRFATRRLGSKLEIRTKTTQNPYEYVLKIDWNEFDNVSDIPIDLDSIGVSLTREKPKRDYGVRGCGTQIVIFGGREGFDLTDSVIKEINRIILQLKSPFRSPEKFDVIFECPQISDLDTALITDEFEPSFSFLGIVDENGLCDFELTFNPPKNIPMVSEKIKRDSFDLKSGDYWKERIPECGPFQINLSIWYRTAPWLEGLKVKEFTEYLERFGGITIYRDGLNVFSSDEGSKIDWLDLSVRHIKRGIHLSYYNMLGSVEIEQGKNPTLIDKTNREGFLKNQSFLDMSKLVQAITYFIENYFVGKRDDYNQLTGDVVRDVQQITNASKDASSFISVFADNYNLEKDPLGLIEKSGKKFSDKTYLLNLAGSLKKLQKSIEAMEEAQSVLTEQAGYGLAVAVSVHEIAKLTTDFYNQVIAYTKAGKPSKEQIETLKGASDSLKTELRRLGSLRAVRTERPICFNVLKSIQYAVAVHRRILEKMGIEIVINGKKGFNVYSRFGALNQIFSNLLSNSEYWIGVRKGQTKEISIDIDEEYRTVLVADSGTDIDDSIRKYLFQAGYSLKKPPSGLGLFVCKYYMQDMKGDIYLAPPKERDQKLTGAQFILDFHKVPESEKGE